MTDIFKAYEIRGSYPDELDEAKAKRIGFAFIRLLQCIKKEINKIRL